MSELTDLEICEQLAKVKGFNILSDKDKGIFNLNLNKCYVGSGVWCGKTFDPLTDDALCFQLMVEYSITFYKSELEDAAHFYTCCSTRTPNLNHTIYNKNPNRAICLAIIESHKGK